MPANDDVRLQLSEILGSVVGSDASQVVPEARLVDLGVDSLAAVEIGDALGERFGVYLSDEAVDSIVTVQDAVDAVVAQLPRAETTSAPEPPAAPQESAPAAVALSAPAPQQRSDHHRASAAWRLAAWMVIAGGALGLAFGLGGAAVVGATGLGSVDLPPLVAPTTTPTPTTPPPTTPAPAPTDDAVPPPTLTAESGQVSPGQRFRLSGAFAELGKGAVLQVQVRDPGADWDDFPITTTTGANGSYATVIYTSRTGKREFRMLHKDTDTASPVVTVQIG